MAAMCALKAETEQQHANTSGGVLKVLTSIFTFLVLLTLPLPLKKHKMLFEVG